jgi:peptide/nickel transport system substrate-binding protein
VCGRGEGPSWRLGRRAIGGLFIAALVLTACLDNHAGPRPPAGGNAQVTTGSDLNPRDPTTLQEGGQLRLALSEFPANFNPAQVDGGSAETTNMLKPTMPQAFRIGPDGSPTLDTDYFTSAELTSSNPQVVTYTINPKAIWSDGTPITWEDIASEVHATRGRDTAFAIVSPVGSDRVASVTRGVDDRQAVMTFAKPYAEWRAMFAGNGMLLPKAMTTTPEVFNKGFLNSPGPSAGPFMVSSVDRIAQRITLTRNPKWWGRTPRLDGITYLVLDDAALMPALQNDAIDATAIASPDELTVAQRTPGIAIRRAPGANWYQFTFNGAPGAILADPRLRAAIAEGIDRQAIATVTQRGLVDTPVPLNNHVFVAGQQGYQDNSTTAAYDPQRARRELDALGWKLNGRFREKDGRRLLLRDMLFDAQGTRQIALVTQHSLAQIGVDLEIDPEGADLFSGYISVGNFDIAQFGWSGSAFPLSGLAQIYASGQESNFGNIGSPELDAKIEQALQELDPDKARALANQADELIWAEGFSLPLTQSAGIVAERQSLANFGAAGIGDIDYTKTGFTK